MGEMARGYKPQVPSGLPHCTPKYLLPCQTDISEDLTLLPILCGKVHLSKKCVLLLSAQKCVLSPVSPICLLSGTLVEPVWSPVDGTDLMYPGPYATFWE